MLRSNLTIAFRQLIKQPLFSFIKIVGLTVGVTGCLVIFVMARFELSFDKFQTEGDRIFRIYSEFSGVFKGFNSGVPEALPGVVNSEFTGVEAVTHFHTLSDKVQVTQGTEVKKFDDEKDIVLAGPEFFKVFTFHEWVAGKPENLNEPFTVVLTEEKAKKYFGVMNPTDAMGRPITYKDSLNLTVVGILKDVKENTDIHFTDFISNATWQKSWLKNDFNDITDWGSTNSSTQCFVKVAKGTSLDKIEGQMPLLVKRYEESQKERDKDWIVSYKLQPLSALHYNKDFGTFDNGRPTANLGTIRMLAFSAFLLLVIAAINFINLETAQAVRRSKEVGLRKTMGGTYGSLIRSFLFESSLLATFSVLLAIPLAQVSIIFFEEFLPKGVNLNLADPATIAFLGGTIITVAILSGLYPAFVLSSYQPAEALKNQFAIGRNSGSALLRRVLTVFQFSFSQALIIGTVIVSWQIKYMVEKDMGFDREAIITIGTPWWLSDNRPSTLQNELVLIPEIQKMSRNDSPPARSGYSTSTLTLLEKDTERPLNVHQRSGDTTYLSLYNIKLVAGRMVQANDSAREYLVNEAYCRELGYQPADMVGQFIKEDKNKHFTIVGVMKDFHLQSLQNKIEPLSFKYRKSANGFALKLGGNPANFETAIGKIKEAWGKIYPDVPFDYSFVDDRIRKFYAAEQKTAKLTNTATGLTIFISCLGLLGLAAFTATQRTKEIGIRKVLGASVTGIVGLLSKEFMALVIIAFLVAAPLAWYGGNEWLSKYAFRIEIGWEIFALAGGVSVILAFLTVGFQTLMAALANPVDSLKYE